MLSAFFVSTLLGAQAPVELGAAIQDVRRAFIEDGADRVSATPTHRVISHADGSLELQGSQPLRLNLLSVKREQGPSCSAHFLERVVGFDDPRTVRASRSCDVEERWTNEAAGLSHAFTVQRAPSGSGGLTLRLSVEGPWHHHDELGHVFKGPGAAASLRYGNAFVVRGGIRFPIPVVHVEGALELRVPAALVEAPGAFPMEIDPVLSAEVELDQLINASAPPTQEEGPAIAVNTSGVALVVWVDSRRQLGTDIFGARFSPTGALTDQVGLPLVIAPGHQVRPTVCADGNNFLIAWDTPLLDGGFQVRARPVSAGGAPGQEFIVAAGSQPSLASRGGDAGMMLAYVDPSSVVQVEQVTAFAAGMPAGSSSGNERAERPALAASPGGWYVAWQSTVLGSPVASIQLMASTSIGPNVIPLYTNTSPNQAMRPTVALSTTALEEQAFVAWEEGGDVKAAQYSTLAVTNFFSIPNATSPALVRTSQAVGAFPTLSYFISLNRLQVNNLNDGGTTNVMVGPRSNELVMAASGSKLMAAWTESPIGMSGDIHGAAISAGATASNPTLLLSRAAASQRDPEVALMEGSSVGLAAWVQGSNVVRASKVIASSSGLLLGVSFDVTAQNQQINELAIAVEGASNSYLVVWRQGTSIMGAFTTTAGPAETPFIISNVGATAGPAVSFDQGSGNFVVAWTQDLMTPKVVSVTVSRGGTLSLQRVHSNEGSPRVAVNCMRSKCLVGWETTTRDVRATVYSTANGPSFTWNGAALPAAANDGSNFYLGWTTGNSLAFARFDFTTGAATSVPVWPQASTLSLITRLSMASAIPPVVSWAELSLSEASTVSMSRLEVQATPVVVGSGSAPAVGLSTVENDPTGVIVYQRYIVGDGANAFRAFGKELNFAPDASFIDAGFDAGMRDAGVDGGVDAGIDGGVDAGEDVDGGLNPSDGGVDAGVDAGSPDGGVMMFDTTGCTCNSGSAAPLILLALFAFRRRR